MEHGQHFFLPRSILAEALNPTWLRMYKSDAPSENILILNNVKFCVICYSLKKNTLHRKSPKSQQSRQGLNGWHPSGKLVFPSPELQPQHSTLPNKTQYLQQNITMCPPLETEFPDGGAHHQRSGKKQETKQCKKINVDKCQAKS